MSDLDPADVPIIAGAVRTLRAAAARAREAAFDARLEVEHHGRVDKVSTPESALLARRAAMWDACADDVEALLGPRRRPPDAAPLAVAGPSHRRGSGGAAASLEAAL